MVVGAKPADEPFRYADQDTVLQPDSVLIVEGAIDRVQQFAALS
jgi:trk system potassium uptake protein TrkA